VKYHFLLDENVFHFAIKGVDAHGNPDLTCTQLLLLVSRNCHRIIISTFLLKRYIGHLESLKHAPPGVLQPAFVLTQLIHNSAKIVPQYDNPPHLPANHGIPTEDVEVVRAALISRPKFVTADEELREAINHCGALQLNAIDPPAAILLAEET
jgi:hypothetical protein